MIRMLRLIESESFKLFTATSTWVVAAAMIIGTWVMSYLESYESVGISPDDPRLYSNVPTPAEYNGFDMAGWGYVFVVALPAIWAVSEYGRGGQIRTTLAATPQRARVFMVKAGLCAAVVAALAFISMSGGVMVAHYLALDGIDPIVLTPAVWAHLAGLTYGWTMVGLLSFSLSMLTRSAIPALAILLPLVIGVGDFLATMAPAARYLPTVAAEGMYTSQQSATLLTPVIGGVTVGLWGFIPLVLAAIVFTRRDVS